MNRAIALLLVFSLAASACAFSAAHQVSGNVYDNQGNPVTGVRVTAWINGEDRTGASSSNNIAQDYGPEYPSYFVIDVQGSDNEAGETISFKIDGAYAAETLPYEAFGSTDNLSLHLSGGRPAAGATTTVRETTTRRASTTTEAVTTVTAATLPAGAPTTTSTLEATSTTPATTIVSESGMETTVGEAITSVVQTPASTVGKTPATITTSSTQDKEDKWSIVYAVIVVAFVLVFTALAIVLYLALSR